MAEGSRRRRRQSEAGAEPQASSPPQSAVTPKDPTKQSNPEGKIFARNLTARAAYRVPGNPVVTRPEDAVANCFPGLEIDVRNLDRRFFPGLVFEFITEGARLAYVDLYEDPDLKLDTEAATELKGRLTEEEETLAEGTWFLDTIEQKGKKISVRRLGDTEVWRIVRSLERAPVTISLRQRRTNATLGFAGWRRQFTDETTGVINAAYKPGELMQGLCSPWQHDFRDCACFYWASNHPDIVLGERYPGESVTPDEPYDPTVPLDWLRSDRAPARATEALGTIDKNRPHQIDHFQVNSVWQDLSIVVEGREISGLYIPQTIKTANPLRSPGELASELVDTLGPLEIALTFEYLYAWSSLLSEDEVQDEALRGALAFAREQLLLVAVSEMQHLRWVNQLLWRLYHAKLIPDEDFSKPQFEPVLVRARKIPTSSATALMQLLPQDTEQRKERRATLVEQFVNTDRAVSSASKEPRDAALRPLTPAVILDFIAVEHPSGAIDGAYAKVIATLRQEGYPEHMVELALRIASDGVQHEKRFREIREALSFFFPQDGAAEDASYLRRGFKEAALEDAAPAAAALQAIKNFLREAYGAAARRELEDSGEQIANARIAMTHLRDVADALARKSRGIPFFDIWDNLP
jgi:hypothetical protein